MSPFNQSGGAEGAPRPDSPNLAKRSFAFSVALHAALAVGIAVAGFFSVHRKREPPRDVLMEFTVAVPPQEEAAEPPKDAPPPETRAQEPPPPPPKDEIRIPKKPPEKPPKPKFEKGKLVERDPPKRDRQIVEKPEKKPVARKIEPRKIEIKGPRLSPDEIKKLLDKGATVSDHTSIPTSERDRCFALIYNAIKKAWICPDSSAISTREPEISFSLGPGGSLGNVRLERSSGNETLDQSVLGAARAVRSVAGLSPGFIRDNPRLTVAFSLEGV